MGLKSGMLLGLGLKGYNVLLLPESVRESGSGCWYKEHDSR